MQRHINIAFFRDPLATMHADPPFLLPV